MAGLYENQLFDRGGTYGVPANDPSGAAHLEGKEYVVPDTVYNTGMMVRLRICRNNSGIPLQGKRAVKFNMVAGKALSEVSGYATTAGEPTAIVDDKISGAGVPNGDLFYVIVGGPCLAKLGLAGDATNTVAVGDPLHAMAAASTGATTAGRVGPASFAGSTSALAGQIANVVGYAMSAKTAANSGQDVLIKAGPERF